MVSLFTTVIILSLHWPVNNDYNGQQMMDLPSGKLT